MKLHIVLKMAAGLFILSGTFTGCDEPDLEPKEMFVADSIDPNIPADTIGSFLPNLNRTLPKRTDMPEYWLSCVKDGNGEVVDSFTYYSSGNLKAWYKFDKFYKKYEIQLYQYDSLSRIKRIWLAWDHQYGNIYEVTGYTKDTVRFTDTSPSHNTKYTIYFNSDGQIANDRYHNENGGAYNEYPIAKMVYEEQNLVSYRIRYWLGNNGEIVNCVYKYNNIINPYTSVIKSNPIFGYYGWGQSDSYLSHTRNRNCMTQYLQKINTGAVFTYDYTYVTDPVTGWPVSRTMLQPGTEMSEKELTYHYIRP